MELNFLVINKNKTKFVDKFKLFSNPQAAIDYVNELGWLKISFIGGLNVEELQPGVCHSLDAGDISLEVIAIEVDRK